MIKQPQLADLFPGGYLEAVELITSTHTLKEKNAALVARIVDLEDIISGRTTVTRTVITDKYGYVSNTTETTVTNGMVSK